MLRTRVPAAGAGLTFAVGGQGVRALLLDIEGTTTPLEFVTGVLFPFARAHVRAFLGAHAADPAVREDLARLRAEHAEDQRQGLTPPPWSDAPAGAVAYVHFLMDHDRKSTGLKALQGRLWDEGYRSGVLAGDLYPDVPAAFARWRGDGRDIAIFSSGSVLAQKLLFGHTPVGDLTGFIRSYFDTTSGPKRDPQSYRTIAAALGFAPADVLFVSDVGEELDAARTAGMETALCVRPGTRASAGPHPAVSTFDLVCP